MEQVVVEVERVKMETVLILIHVALQVVRKLGEQCVVLQFKVMTTQLDEQLTVIEMALIKAMPFSYVSLTDLSHFKADGLVMVLAEGAVAALEDRIRVVVLNHWIASRQVGAQVGARYFFYYEKRRERKSEKNKVKRKRDDIS